MGKRKTPWLVQGAIDFMDYHIRHNWRIFEFGSGASTVWCRIRCRAVVSVEHDMGYISPGVKYHTLPYHNYLHGFRRDSFDLILIDGRGRNECLGAAVKYVRPGGFIVLDNSERPRYRGAIERYTKGWNRFVFCQNQPDRYGFYYPNWQTSIFQRPEVNDET